MGMSCRYGNLTLRERLAISLAVRFYNTRARIVNRRCIIETPLLYLKKGACSLERSWGFRKAFSNTSRLTAKAHPIK